MAVPKKQREANGYFAEGNDLAKEHYFQPGNDGGTKYKPEYAKKLIEYFKDHEGFPTLENFAGIELGVSINTITNWAKDHPEFDEAVTIAKTIQLGKMHEGTMMKRYDATYARFLAINNHGMTDKSQVDIGNKDDEGFKVTVTVDD